jgi:hypothetical protein
MFILSLIRPVAVASQQPSIYGCHHCNVYGSFNFVKLFCAALLISLLKKCSIYGYFDSLRNFRYSFPDILGPPGSGVEWFRIIVEQLTGLHTGSLELRHPELFVGEGQTNEV